MIQERPDRETFRSLFTMGPVKGDIDEEELRRQFDLAVIDLQQSHGFSEQQARDHILGFTPADYAPAD